MKRLLLFLPLLALGGCAYQSMAEAQIACDDWRIRGFKITQKCGKQSWKKDCIPAEEREERINAVKKANTVDGMVDMKAVAAAITEIPQAFTEVVDSPRKCVLERDTQQVMGLERGKGIVQRFRY